MGVGATSCVGKPGREGKEGRKEPETKGIDERQFGEIEQGEEIGKKGTVRNDRNSGQNGRGAVIRCTVHNTTQTVRARVC